jgi:hypothetical protein
MPFHCYEGLALARLVNPRQSEAWGPGMSAGSKEVCLGCLQKPFWWSNSGCERVRQAEVTETGKHSELQSHSEVDEEKWRVIMYLIALEPAKEGEFRSLCKCDAMLFTKLFTKSS